MPRRKANTATEIVEKPSTEVSENVIDLREFVGDTAEDFGVDDFTVPFILLLQDKAKRVQEGSSKYLEGARPGMIYNSAENVVYSRKDGIEIVPCAYTSVYMEWISREAGGGLVGIYSAVEGKRMLATADRDDRGKAILENGNELALCHQHYVLVMGGDSTEMFPAIIPMAASQIKYSKRWNYQMSRFRTIEKNQVQPDPTWMRIWHATTTLDEAKGHTFYSWEITEPRVIQDQQLLLQAKAFREACREGVVKTDDSNLGDIEQ